MHAATKDNIGRSMAILFIEQKPRVRKTVKEGQTVEEYYTVEERRLISVATVQAALGFNFRITGLDLREAQDLALLLRAGALAAPMYIVEERTVEPNWAMRIFAEAGSRWALALSSFLHS